MKKILKSFIAIILSAALLMQLSGCGLIPLAILLIGNSSEQMIEDPTTIPIDIPTDISYDREDIPFSSLSYSRPDTDAIRSSIESLKKEISSGADVQKVLADYADILADYEHLDTMASLAYILYSKDVTEEYYDNEYTYLVAEADDLDLLLTDLTIQMYETEGIGDALLDAYGPTFEVNAYKSKERNSEEILDNLNRFTEISSEYDTMLSTFRMVYNGKEYSEDDLVNSYDGNYDEYMRKVNAFYSQMNEKIGPLFLELVQNNKQIAQKLGYATFTEYQYEGYERDYSPEDAKKIHQAVKDYLVPLYTDIYDDVYYYSGAADYEDSISITYSDFLDKFTAAIYDLSPEMTEPLAYLQKNDLIDLEKSNNKMMTSYTIYLADPHLPFIFMQWENSFDNCATLTHEFGHFAHYFLNPNYGWNVSDPLDIDEIDSQGLELLMMKNYDTFYGSRKADALRGSQLMEAIYVIISGCMEDEFQQTVYESPDMTLEEINQLYGRLAEEYGLADLFSYVGEEWVAIPHTFQSPLYYFSYAASMIVAVELWILGQDNVNAAEDAYLTIQSRPEEARLRTLAQDCHLADPIDPGTIHEITSALQSWMNGHF